MKRITKKKLYITLASVVILIAAVFTCIRVIHPYHNYFYLDKVGIDEPSDYYRLENHELSTWKYFDENGIVMWDYGSNLGKQYNPVTCSQYALANYNNYLRTQNKQYRYEFLKHADWLVKSQVTTNKGIGLWYYLFDFSAYQCRAPWISAMAQGQAISVLVRAYTLTGNTNYLQVAKSAVKAFEYPVNEGGVRFTDNDGNTCYLEFACQSRACVLNGFIFSLVGLHDYYKYTRDEQALKFFNKGIKTLNITLQYYDTGDWTRHYILGPRVSVVYHKLHCKQLYELYYITGDLFFLNYARRWETYLKEYGTPQDFCIEAAKSIRKR